jgi:predicted amidohydrolase
MIMSMDVMECGTDTGRGNLLGVQPVLAANDYASEEIFHVRLDGYMTEARARGWLSERTVVVFPEHVGTWLAASGAHEAVFAAPTIARAMRTLIFRNPLAFGAALLAGREKDQTSAALFRMRAKTMARIYQAVFSRLARDYSVTVVAGSLVLPAPCVDNGRIMVGSGLLYNTCAVFGPDGRAYSHLVRKVYPVTDELAFTSPAPLINLPTFDTPAGRLGVLICADCWYPAPYDTLRAASAELIAVPSFVMGSNSWDRPWQGYDGAPTPEDVDPTDVRTLTEGQAWRKYALAGRMARSGARYAVNVFLRGGPWDLGGDSGVATGIRGEDLVEAGRDGAALVNVWLE